MSSRGSSPNSGRGRRRSESEEGDRRPRHSRSRSHDPEDVAREKRARTEPEWANRSKRDPYGVAAREITRVIDMFWEPRDVISAGVRLISLESDEAAAIEVVSATGRRRKDYEIFERLCERLPDLAQTLEGGQDAWDDVRIRFEHGKSAAKTEDNHIFKRWSPTWRAWDPPLSNLEKADRGLAHEECAKFLRPNTIDWKNVEAVHKFRVEQDPPMTGDAWPALLWEDSAPDPDDLDAGLFQNELLFKAARAVLFPPSQVNLEGPQSNKSNRQPKAAIYKMKSVTAGLIAYAAVQLRFTLSTEPQFNETGGAFNYRLFYNDLVASLDDPEFISDNEDLFKWWNQRMFPPQATRPTGSPTSTLMRLRQQRERNAQRREQLEAAAV